MALKLNRSDIQMDVKKALKEIKREIGVRANLYPGWIAAKKLAQHTAGVRFVALLEVKELLELIERKELSFDQVKSLLNSVHPGEYGQQARMNFGTGNREPKNPT